MRLPSVVSAKAMPVVASVSGCAVAEGRFGLVDVGDAGEDADFNEAGIVEGVVEDQLELLLWGHGRQLGIGGDGTEVGDDEEDALGLLGPAI
jgi:hypothetical protein